MKFLLLLLLLLFQSQPAEKATVSGRVLRMGTNEPIQGAEVTIGQGPTRTPPVITDDKGEFVVKGIEPGQYVAQARKVGYAAQTYGAVQPGYAVPSGIANIKDLSEVATLITLESGKAVQDIVFHMSPAAVVSGRLLGDAGEPLAGIQLELISTLYDGTGRRPMGSLFRTGTDDRGEFRFFSVEPGRYYLCASWTPSVMVIQEAGGQPSGFITGNPTNKKYVVTFYPGVSTVAGAAVIDVKSGEEQTNLNFSMLPGSQQTYKIAGRFIDGTTQQAPSVQGVLSHGVSLIPRNADFLNSIAASDPHLNADGTFEIRDVQPGSYWLHVQSSAPMVRPTGPEQPIVLPPSIVASIPVDIVAADIEGLVVRMVSGVTVSGRLHADNKELSQIKGMDSFRVQLRVVRIGTMPMNMMPDPKPAGVEAGDSFVVENVYAGAYRLTFSGLPAGVYVKKAQLGEVDALGESISIVGLSYESLELVVSDRMGEIRGSVSDKESTAVPNAQVVLIPDKRNTRPELYRTVKSAADGKFAINDIVPGDYQLFAWEELRRFAYFDPAFVQEAEPQGRAVHIEEDSSESVNVTVITRQD